MKNVFLASLVIFVTSTLWAQDNTTHIKLEAQKSADALLAGDYKTIVAYIPKKIVTLMGGEEAMITSIKKGIAEMGAQGIEIKDAQIGDPKVPQKIAGWLVSVVPQKVVLKVPNGRLESESYLVGLSEDDGKSWVFIDGSGLSKENGGKFAQVFPELADKLQLPAKKQPVFTEEKNYAQ